MLSSVLQMPSLHLTFYNRSRNRRTGHRIVYCAHDTRGNILACILRKNHGTADFGNLPRNNLYSSDGIIGHVSKRGNTEIVVPGR